MLFLRAGDGTFSRFYSRAGEPAKIAWYNADTGRVGITFSYEGAQETVPYSSRFREKDKDSSNCARLQRLQPSAQPGADAREL